jgi:hypothetical protein
MLQGRPGAKGRDTAVEMALDPEEIDFDSETMALKAEAALRSTSFIDNNLLPCLITVLSFLFL